MSGAIDHSPGRTRIDSWKEIASFFGRDERTVKRWEKSRHLPIRRLPGAKSGVFAYSDELLHWLHSREGEPHVFGANEDGAVLAANAGPQLSIRDGRTVAAPRLHPRHRELFWMTSFLSLLMLVFSASHLLHILRDASVKSAVPLARAASPATEIYLQGRYYWSHRTEGSLRQAVDAFSQAVARDPRYAPAYAGLADSYNLMPEYTGMPEAKAYPIAIESARQAVALDGSLAEAHRALAFGLFFWDWDADQAFSEFRRAAQLDPSDEDVHCWFAHALFTLGRYAEAKSEMERARQIEPKSRSVLASQGLIRYWAGERAASIAQLQELEATEPDFSAPAAYLALIYFNERNYPAYIEQLKLRAARTRKPGEFALANAAETGWNRAGERGMLEGIRAVYLRSFESGNSSGYDLAIVCARLGRRDEADKYLQAAIEARDHHAIRVLRGDLDTEMRGDERFEQLKRLIRQRLKFTAGNAAN